MTRAAFALVLQLQLPAAHLQPTAPTCSAAHLQRGHRCEPYAEVCRGSVIYTCSADGRWHRGIDCARAGRPDRVTICSVEPDGSAVCVEDGGAS